MNKRILIFLLSIIIVILLIMLTFLTYKKAEGKPMEYVKNHKAKWIDLLSSNSEVLPYMQKLYTTENELTINYRNGKLTINESASTMFNPHELEKLEQLFIKFQWETVRLRNKTDIEEKVLEVISTQIIINNFFRKHYGVAFLVYSPNDNPHSGEEIFPGWYYVVLFNT